MNFINSWKKGNKKNKIDISLRIGFFTLLEIIICAESKCEEDCKCPKVRLMLFNFGVEF